MYPYSGPRLLEEIRAQEQFRSRALGLVGHACNRGFTSLHQHVGLLALYSLSVHPENGALGSMLVWQWHQSRQKHSRLNATKPGSEILPAGCLGAARMLSAAVARNCRRPRKKSIPNSHSWPLNSSLQLKMAVSINWGSFLVSL